MGLYIRDGLRRFASSSRVGVICVEKGFVETGGGGGRIVSGRAVSCIEGCSIRSGEEGKDVQLVLLRVLGGVAFALGLVYSGSDKRAITRELDWLSCVRESALRLFAGSP